MRIRAVRALCVAACLFALAGCGATPSSFKLGSLLPGGADDTPPPPAASPAPDVTGSIAAPAAAAEDAFAVKDALLGGDPTDDLTLGKRHYRERNYGLAEKHFRRAVETLPRDGEAWLGLAASYDRLKRYELADRACRGGATQEAGAFEQHGARALAGFNFASDIDEPFAEITVGAGIKSGFFKRTHGGRQD